MKIGILGAGGIAVQMAKTVAGMKDVENYAVAARSFERAQAFAEKYGFSRAYGSYEEMLADPQVDLVYIATPHSHHYLHAKMCLEAGKNVLCEKAFTVNADQARKLFALAKEKNLLITEAIWTRYMPSRKMIDDIISSGVIGEVTAVTANLNYAISEVERIRKPELAGGALLDVGVYTINFASMVLGDKQQILYGKGYIEDTLCGCTFRISPKSFYQVNPVQTEILYNKAITYAGLTGKEKVIDAYCGTGTIGLIAASQAKEVIGVELNRDAVRDAVINAKRNNIKNEQFYNADAGKFMVELSEQNKKVDVVFMDPPRAGSDEAFLSSVVKLAPKKVVYVSCNPETLARDLKYLTRHGYQAVECQPCDMFPFTKHVETVVLLSKGEIDSKKVRVEFSLEDMDMSGFQKDATYEQIKAYVLEHTGLKVSSLYISQIKRKCGLDVGQNYNLSKKEDAKVPKCPPEKEAAIRDALKYFQMI